MKQKNILTILITAVLLAFPGTPWIARADDNLRHKADTAIENLRSCDSTLTNLFEHSAGYAVFPNVTRCLNCPAEQTLGVLYENGKVAGQGVLVDINPERRSGMKPFHEIIFFENAKALDVFKQRGFQLDATIPIVAAAEGAASNATYQRGMIVFAVPKDGLMETTTIWHQWFLYDHSTNTTAH